MAGRLPLEVLLDELNQTFLSKNPLRIGAGGGTDSRYRGAIDDVRIHDDVLSAQEVAVLATPESIGDDRRDAPGASIARRRLTSSALAFLETARRREVPAGTEAGRLRSSIRNER